MRAIPPALDRDVVAEIDRRLNDIESSGARIAWAIESGSRAWGFPSPDSDYDCRFLFVRPASAYLSLWPERDVIETPLDAVFDVNGWDLAKTIRLIVKSNATALEWLRSPIVYRGDEAFRDALLGLAAEVVTRDRIGRHYLHTGRAPARDSERLKHFFYALRPAFALRWLRDYPESALPPMALPELVRETSVEPAIAAAVADLIRRKAVTREAGTGSPPSLLVDFVDRELRAAEAWDEAPGVTPADARRRADEVFAVLLDASSA